jgi:integrase
MARRKQRRGQKGDVWFRSSTQTWYARLRGKQVPVTDGDGRRIKGREKRAAAEAAWRASTTRPSTQTNDGLLVREVCERYMAEAPAVLRRGKKGCANVGRFLKDFCAKHPALIVAALRPQHAYAWVAARPTWSGDTRWTGLTHLKAVFNWAAGGEVGLISRNPLHGLSMPERRSRGGEALVDPTDHERLMAAACPALRDVLFALQQTGCRPGEVAAVTAADFDERSGVWILHDHKTRGRTHEPRVVPLTEGMIELCRRLAAKRPTGPLFRSKCGRAWHGDLMNKAILRLRRKLGLPRVTAYYYRHTFATEALSRGVPDALVSGVLGHEDTKMLHRHYRHLTARVQALREVVNRVAGVV